MPVADLAALFALLLCCAGADAALNLDSRFGINLQEIQARSPYKYVREIILAAEGETKAITCSFDNLYTAGKHWRRTFYSPVTWFSYTPGAKAAVEEPITDGKSLPSDGGKQFAFKLMKPMSAAPSSILVLPSVPLRLSGTYFICKTSLQPASVQAFYLKVVKPTLHTPGVSGGGRLRAKLGTSLKLDCRTSNNYPMTSVYWSRTRTDAKWTGRRPVLAWGATYELASVTIEDARYQYTCHVNNHLDPEWTAHFSIILISSATKAMPGRVTATYNGVRPAFRGSSSQAMPRYNSAYTMSCRAQGDGIKFVWLRNGTEIQPFADPNVYTYSSSLGQLHFTDLILRKFRPGDRTTYECQASNEAGDRAFKFDLASLGPSPPPDTLGPEIPGGSEKQPQLGSGWGPGGGSGDDEADDAAAPPQPSLASAVVAARTSGDRQPPQRPSAGGDGDAERRRLRARRRRGRNVRRLPLP